jgi:PAS domain S-box-containing protein
MTANTQDETGNSIAENNEIISSIELCAEGTIQKWNTEAENLRGYRKDEIIGQHFNIFYLPEDRQKNLPQHLLQVAKKEGIAMHECMQLSKTGTTFYSVAVITPLYDKDEKKIIGFKHEVRVNLQLK